MPIIFINQIHIQYTCGMYVNVRNVGINFMQLTSNTLARTFTCTYARARTHTPTHIHKYIYTHTYTYTQTYINA